ncbi:MAG: glutamate-5-semialdehyde dehydrogenase [Clostridiales bacterium]|nr:glutamate-5-semialdehyde dehydrogenase [Clostridiales bacterium]
MTQNDTIRRIAGAVKADSFKMAALSGEERNAALRKVAAALKDREEEIFAANRLDLENAEKVQLAAPIVKRLKFDEAKLRDVIAGIESLTQLPDPLFKVLLDREMDEGLHMKKVTCPIGVIGVIFESRPDALVQIASLCLKSGNCAILKGGSEAANTNRILYETIHKAGVEAGLPEHFLTLIESREDIGALLKCDEYIDLLIPRGSNAFVQYIMENSRIPVMGHADGVCHIYVDKAADMSIAAPIIADAKTQYVAACNTVETLLVHRDAAPALLPAIQKLLSGEGKDAAGKTFPKVELRGDEGTQKLIPCLAAEDADWDQEYVDYILSIKLVDSLEEAIDHINLHGSHHTDCIITEDEAAAEKFMMLVDSAGVYQNISTRFADGFRYGFGAEVGISTGKLHARGPVGLEGLVTYKYKITGKGHIVADYSEGRKAFHFKDF